MDDFIYHKYLKNNEKFFEKVVNTNTQQEIKAKNLPPIYRTITEESSPWVYYHNKNEILPDQGWKIHISTGINEFSETLDNSLEVIYKYEVSFKHLKTFNELFKSNSKHSNRASSGKFIVVYPKTKSEFITIVNELQKALKNMPKGPYILSDKRWKNSNVFYRYGGFKNITNDKGELCIKDLNGNLVLDERTPFYHVPDWEKDFDNYLNELNYYNDDLNDNKLKNYEITSAIMFSNGGGIYKGKSKKDNIPVIIKEARLNTGLDGKMKTAQQRQDIEYEALSKLINTEGIVNIIDKFNVWEHQYLIEEFVDGITLHSWIAKHYPFHDFDIASNSKYKQDIIKILDQLINIVSNMHEKGIVMGDIQPNNILIDNDLGVNLIDFETASNVSSIPDIGLEVPSFSNNNLKVNINRDWYALKKILKYCLIPTQTTKELDDYFSEIHRNWILETYGHDFEYLENKILSKFDSQDIAILDNIYEYEQNNVNLDINSLITKIEKGILTHLQYDRILTKNDVRQYETEYGHLNILSGAYGVLWSLLDSDMVDNTYIESWINKFGMSDLINIKDDGLFTGKSGIAVVLYEYGFKKDAISLLESIDYQKENSDISLLSGLSGIGLALLSLYVDTQNQKYLYKVEEIANKIIYNFKNGVKHESTDPHTPALGLINSWTGASVFLTALYKHTHNNQYLNLSLEILKSESNNLREAQGTLQLFDQQKSRLLPYLSIGSIGIGIAMKYYQNISGNHKEFVNQISKISNLYSTNGTLMGGLFHGAASFLFIPELINNSDQELYDKYRTSSLKLMNLFLASENNYILLPGEMNYRFTFDFFSGSAGVLSALKSLKMNDIMSWIPCINNNKTF